jgi:hypothetical protein
MSRRIRVKTSYSKKERKKQRTRSKNVKCRVATEEYLKNRTPFSRVRGERIWLSRVKIIEREWNARRGDIEDLGRNKSKLKIAMECNNFYNDKLDDHNESTGCPSLLSCGWTLTELVYGFILVTNYVRNIIMKILCLL